MRASRQTLRRALIACVFAALTTTPAFAEDKPAPTREVRYGDLDLTTAKGISRLNARVRSAARSICNYSGYGAMEEGLLTRPCVSDVVRRSAPDVELAILSQRDNQFAARTTALTIGVAR